MIRRACAAAALWLWPAAGLAQPAAGDPPRPAMVANVNLITFGGGSAQFDHPNFAEGAYPTAAYQRRVLRREMRIVPIWLRGALQHQTHNANFYGYTVWGSNEIAPTQENVFERTRDISLRGEAIGDLFHQRWMALYAGVGFVLHSLRFTSDGSISAIPIFEASLTATSPSALFGWRVFSPTRPYTGYFEVRYGRAYGKTDDYQGRQWLTEATFQFTSVEAVFLEGGVGFHW